MERATGFEPATSTLGSTLEPKQGFQKNYSVAQAGQGGVARGRRHTYVTLTQFLIMSDARGFPFELPLKFLLLKPR